MAIANALTRGKKKKSTHHTHKMWLEIQSPLMTCVPEKKKKKTVINYTPLKQSLLLHVNLFFLLVAEGGECKKKITSYERNDNCGVQ